MPTDRATPVAQPATQNQFEKYLVLAAGMATYDGASIEAYQTVMVSAKSEEDALERAFSALESRAGFVPVSAHTAAELHELADALCARELDPDQAYNLTMEMNAEEMVAWDEDEDDKKPECGADQRLTSQPTRSVVARLGSVLTLRWLGYQACRGKTWVPPEKIDSAGMQTFPLRRLGRYEAAELPHPILRVVFGQGRRLKGCCFKPSLPWPPATGPGGMPPPQRSYPVEPLPPSRAPARR